MPYAVDSKILQPVAKLLPPPAMAEFVVAANAAAGAGMDHNDCMRAAWAEVGESWQRPNGGKSPRWVRKDNPTASTVHTDVPLGAGPKKKPRPKAPAIDDEAGDDIESEVVDQVRRVSYKSEAVIKVDDSLGLVFGWAIVCKAGGQDYFDLQGDHIPEDTMLKAAADFMQDSRVAADMHGRDEYGEPVDAGAVVFCFPMTSDIAKAMGIESQTSGLMIAIKPPDDVLQKFKSGEYTGFSIGGFRGEDEEVPEAADVSTATA